MSTAHEAFRARLLAAFAHFNTTPYKFLDSIGCRSLYNDMSHWIRNEAVPGEATFSGLLALLAENELPEDLLADVAAAYEALRLSQSELDARSNRNRLPKQQRSEDIENYFERIHDSFVPAGRMLGQPETFQQFLFDTVSLPRYDQEYRFALRCGNAIYRTVEHSYARFGIREEQADVYVGMALSELALAACHAGDKATLVHCIDELQFQAKKGAPFLKVFADKAVGAYSTDSNAAFAASENVLKSIGAVSLPLDFSLASFGIVAALARAHIDLGGRLSDMLPVLSGQTLEHAWRSAITDAHNYGSIEDFALSSCALAEALIADGRSKEAENLLMFASFETAKFARHGVDLQLAETAIKTVIHLLK